MSWPSWFTDALARDPGSREWVYSVRREAYLAGLDTIWQVSNHVLDGHQTVLEQYTPTAQSITPRQWQTGGGGFSLVIRGEGAFRSALVELRSGSVVAVYVGLPGMDPADFACLQRGVLLTMSQPRIPDPLYRLEFAPHYAALRCRPADAGGDRGTSLFRLAGQATTLAVAYVAGSGTLQVTSAASLQRQADGDGVILVTPSTGDPFYLKYSGISGSTLAVSTSGGAFGTTDIDAATATVTNVVYLRGHPASILRRLLMSTGTADFTAGTAGTNGQWDVYPEDWGFALPEDRVDLDSLDDLKTRVMTVTSGTYNMELLIDVPVDHAVSWLATWMAPLGMFLRDHQGMISAWAVQNPEATAAVFSAWGVTDTAIVPKGITWLPAMPTGKYLSSTVSSESALSSQSRSYSGTVNLDTLPILPDRDRSLTGIIRDNLTAVCDEVVDRVGIWDTRRQQAFSAPFTDLGLARLGLGDLTRLSTPDLGLFGPDEAASGDTLSAVYAIVTAGPFLDLDTARVSIGLTPLPET